MLNNVVDIDKQLSVIVKSDTKKFTLFRQDGVIYGKAQQTSGMHKEMIDVLTEVYKKDPDVKIIARDLGLNKVFGFKSKKGLSPNIRPDITIVKKDGSFTFIEVLSKSQESKGGISDMKKKIGDAVIQLQGLKTKAKFSGEVWSQEQIMKEYPDIANKILNKGK